MTASCKRYFETNQKLRSADITMPGYNEIDEKDIIQFL